MLHKTINGVDVPMTPEEEAEHLASLPSVENIRAREIRFARDALLSSTDWTQAKDISDAISAKWAPYRQALRDVPQQAGFPNNIQWPVKPE